MPLEKKKKNIIRTKHKTKNQKGRDIFKVSSQLWEWQSSLVSSNMGCFSFSLEIPSRPRHQGLEMAGLKRAVRWEVPCGSWVIPSEPSEFSPILGSGYGFETTELNQALHGVSITKIPTIFDHRRFLGICTMSWKGRVYTERRNFRKFQFGIHVWRQRQEINPW
jgi:hypothetical protein